MTLVFYHQSRIALASCLGQSLHTHQIAPSSLQEGLWCPAIPRFPWQLVVLHRSAAQYMYQLGLSKLLKQLQGSREKHLKYPASIIHSTATYVISLRLFAGN